MHFTIIAAGSRGDVQPYIALGVALQRAGYAVTVSAPQNFAPLATQHALDFAPMPADIQAIYEGEHGLALVGSQTNPLRIFRAIRGMMLPIIEDIWAALWQAVQQTDAIICHTVLTPFGAALAEKVGVPIFSAANMPLMPTREHPFSALDVPTLHPLFNRATYDPVFRLYWALLGDIVNQCRREIGLAAGGYELMRSAVYDLPMLGEFSTAIYPRPHDWRPNFYVTGFWFLEEPAWTPPSTLEAFLAEGEAPIYIGFGSMASRNPEETAHIALEALRLSGERGVIVTGWRGISEANVPANVYVLPAAPHSWLFPRMKAAVHHGGAGTTAAALRAGVPSVIVPFFADQPFWGKRIYAAGLGARHILRRNLTAPKLADAIRAVSSSPSIRQNAARIGAQIRSEDGGAQAVRIIEQVLQLPQSISG